MDIKQYTMLAIGLVVGVLLISGVVVPVIANVSSDGGNGGGSSDLPDNTRYSFADANSDVTFYPVAEGKYSLQPESVADREVYDIGQEFLRFARFDTIEGEAWYLNFRPVETDDGLGFEGGAIGIVKLSVVGTSLIGYHSDNSSYVLVEDSLWYFTNPLGEMIETVSFEDLEDDSFSVYYETPYATEDSPVIMGMTFIDGEQYPNLTIKGSVGDNIMWGTDGYMFGESATFTIEEGILTSVTISLDGVDYAIPLLSGSDPDPERGRVVNGVTFYVDSLILPVSDVGGGSDSGDGGSGSSISGPIKTLLPVIPLLMVVGLVIGAVAIFKMKN